MIKEIWSRAGDTAPLTWLLRQRVFLFLVALLVAIYLTFSIFGIALVRCTFKRIFDVPCLGCGLTTGTKFVLRGEVSEGISHHYLSPVVVLFLLVVPMLYAVPPSKKVLFWAWAEDLEKRSRFGWFVFIALVLLLVLQAWRNYGP